MLPRRPDCASDQAKPPQYAFGLIDDLTDLCGLLVHDGASISGVKGAEILKSYVHPKDELIVRCIIGRGEEFDLVHRAWTGADGDDLAFSRFRPKNFNCIDSQKCSSEFPVFIRVADRCERVKSVIPSLVRAQGLEVILHRLRDVAAPAFDFAVDT